MCIHRITFLFFLVFLSALNTLHAQFGTLPGPGTNVDFEATPIGTYTSANAVSGWTISSQTATSCTTPGTWQTGSPEFSVINTPVASVPNIGTLGNSPFGGSTILQLNNSIANNNVTKIAQTFTITSGNTVFSFAYAGMWQDGGHNCCEQAGFGVQVLDSNGILIPCPTYTVMTPGCSDATTYTLQNGMAWTNWRTLQLPLGQYAGRRVTVEVISTDCIFGDHYGTTFFDAQSLIPSPGGFPGIPGVADLTVPFCPGTSSLTINGIAGYNFYSWAGPAGNPVSQAEASLAAITVTNPLSGSEYSVTLSLGNYYCDVTAVYTLQANPISISAIGSSSSCVSGNAGSASVIAQPQQSLIYSWTDASNTIVGTGSVVTHLPPGGYTVSVSSTYSGCGSVTSTVTVGIISTVLSNTLLLYCGSSAILTAPIGTNYQWYTGNAAVTGTSGTAPNLTVSNPVNYSSYTLAYTSAQSCRDSLKFILLAVTPGSINVNFNNVICQDSSNAEITVSLTPTPNSPSGMHYFIISSTGSNTPGYLSVAGPSATNTFSAGGLSANGNYQVDLSDGICNYTQTFTINPSSFDFSISPQTLTVCSGSHPIINLSFSTTPALYQYTYAWSPATFLSSTVQSTAILSPTAAAGSGTTTTIYSVVVTPSVANCPVTKTFSLTLMPEITPTISAIPSLCSNSSYPNILVAPGSGVFTVNSGIVFPITNSSVTINTATSLIGSNTYTYSGSCITPTTGTYSVLAPYLTATISPIPELCLNSPLQTITVNPTGGFFYGNAINYNGVINPDASLIGINTFTYGGNCIINSSASYSVVAPSLSITGNNPVCAGQSVTLNATGADTYIWSNNATGSSVSIPVYNTTTYTLSGTTGSNSCSSQMPFTVTTFPASPLSFVGNLSNCAGETVTIQVSGAQSYTWSTTSTIDIIAVYPYVSTVYSVAATDSLGCATAGTVMAHVIYTPTVSVTGKNSICIGEQTLLTAHGASAYYWNNAAVPLTTKLVAPITTTVYHIRGVTGQCSDSISFTLSVSLCTDLSSLSTPENEIVIYPTLTDGKFVIHSEQPTKAVLYNSSRELLFECEIGSGKNNLDITAFKNGIYFITLLQQTGAVIKKIIKTD